MFSRIFKVDAKERISVEELQQYKCFGGLQKVTLASLSTESESGDEEAGF